MSSKQPRCSLALVYEPPFERTDAINGFRRDALAVPEPQQGPEPPIPEGRVALNQRGDPRGEPLVHARCAGCRRWLRNASHSGPPREPDTPPFRHPGITALTRPTSSGQKGG